MIADWYFLNCLRFTPRQAAPLLSVLATLDSTACDPEIAALALGELSKADPSVLAYAAPKLFRLLRDGGVGFTPARETIADKILSLTQFVDEAIRPPVQTLVRNATSGSFDQNALEQANRVAGSVLNTLRTGASVTPYLDLAGRFAETLLIEALIAAATRDGGIVENAIADGTSALARFHEAALAGNLGRLAFLQAIRLNAEIRAEQINENALEPFLQLKNSLPLDEPDLVAAIIERLALTENTMAVEYIALRFFRRTKRRLQSYPRHDERTLKQQVLSRLGLDHDPGTVLSILLWQAAVTTGFVRTSTKQFVNSADGWWRSVPDYDPKWPLPIREVGREPSVSTWLECLTALLGMRRLQLPAGDALGILSPSVRGPLERRVTAETVPILFSPWLQAAPPPNQPNAPLSRDHEFLSLLRLSIAAWQSILVLSDAQTTGTEPRCALELVVHFEERVAQPYRNWLEQVARNDHLRTSTAKSLPPEVSSLVLFVRLQVHATIRGFRKAGSPSTYCDLVRKGRDGVAKVLVRWVEDVFRFEGVAPAATAWIQEFRHFGPEAAAVKEVRQTAVLLLKILAQDLLDPTQANTEWQRKARFSIVGTNNYQLVRNRDVLAAPLRSFDEWRNYGHLVVETAPLPLQLSAAIERLLVAFPDSDEGLSIRKQWVEELGAVLGRVAKPEDLDRFASERLLVVALHSVLAGHDDVRLSIVRVLVERAPPAVLVRLARLLRAPPAGEDCSLVWPRLRVAMMRGLFARAFVRAESSTLPADPYYVSQREHEARLCECLGRLFLAGSLEAIAASETELLRSEFRSLATEAHPLSQRQTRVSADGTGNDSESDAASDGVETWMVTQAVEDAATAEFSLVLDMRVPPRPNNPTAPRLAILAGNGPGGTIAVDECGDWHYDLVASAAVARDPGIPVCLYPQDRSIVPLHPTLVPGAIARIELLRPKDGRDAGKIFISVPESGEPPCPAMNTAVWDPDWSRTFLSVRRPHAISGTYLGDNEWAPVVRELSYFLAAEESDGPRRATLTFVSGPHLRQGRESWLFCDRPGELYEFPSEDFEAESLNLLRAEIDDCCDDSAVGLLVSVEVVVGDESARLRLLSAPWAGAIHPQLRCPFDRRNLEWRHCLTTGESVRAEYDATERGWFIPVASIPGFPARLRVRRWSPAAPDTKQQWVTARVDEWREADRRRAWVVATAAGVELNLKDPERLFAHFETLQENSITVTGLYRALGGEIGDEAEIPCLTDEKLRVLVPLDSLTLLPLAHGEFTRELVAPGRNVAFRRIEWLAEEAVNIVFDPPDARPPFTSGWNTGYVVGTPPRNESDGACKILFEIDTSKIYAVRIAANSPLFPGARLRVESKNGRIRSSFIERLRVHATAAVWKIRLATTPPAEGRFVGECEWNRGRYFAVEVEDAPGELYLAAASGTAPSLWAKWNEKQKTWHDGIPESEWRAINTDDTKRFVYLGRRFYRVALRPKLGKSGRDKSLEGTVLTGVSPSNVERGDCRVLRVELQLEKLEGDHAIVHRIFSLGAHIQNPTRPVVRPDVGNGIAKLAAADPIQACFVNWKMKACEIDALQRLGFGEKQSTVPLAKDGGVWVTHATAVYPLRGRAYLELINDAWVANLRRIPAFSLDEFRNDLGAEMGQPLHAPLFFVGPSDATNPGVLRFECGYGKTVDVAETQLRSRNSAFNLRHLLFHGDAIKEFRFVELPASATGPASLGLEIDDIAIDPAPATILYRQAKRHRVVHLLNLRVHAEGLVQVVSVHGCSERKALGADDRFVVPHATLDGVSEKQLTAESEKGRAEAEGDEPVERTVYGRMNISAFEKTHGQSVEFERVRLSQKSTARVRPGELILMRAKEVRILRNDSVVEFEDLADTSSDRLTVRVTRRHFSHRESLLRGLAKNESQFLTEVAGHVFAVRILDPGDDRSLGNGSLKLKIPERRLQSLRDHLAFSDEPFFAVVCDVIGGSNRGEDGIRLEHRPGIFFKLTARDVSSELSMRLAEGTVVQIEIADDRSFRLVACGLGDAEYFRSGPRPVVAFPLNPLIDGRAPTEAQKAGDDWWRPSDRHYPGFSLGDFPGTLCLPGRPGRSVSGADMLKFMAVPHPKIGIMHFERGHSPVLSPADGAQLYGGIAWEESDPLHPLAASPEGGKIPVDWAMLTFSDASVTQLTQRWHGRSWSYHDEITGDWRNGSVHTYDTPVHNLRTGPLFFELISGRPRLRFSYDGLPAKAIPANDLASCLKKTRIVVSIAGVARLGAQDGVYVEYLPGRIVHLPGSLFCWRVGRHRIPLTRFDWKHLAEGDELTVRVSAGAVLAPDHVEVEALTRGPRACFGPQRVLLPVRSFDAENGALALGAGNFCLTLPTATRPEATATWLCRDNTLQTFNPAVPGFQPGDCCLLTIDATSGAVCVAGNPAIRVTAESITGPDPSRIWHSWESDMLGARGTGALRELIQGAGGAIPATVERAPMDGNHVFFSFKYQSAEVGFNRMALASPIGYLAESHRPGERKCERLLLWIGGGIQTCDVDAVICGVPPTLRRACCDSLVQQRVPLWIRTDRNGVLLPGVADDVRSEIDVVPIAVVANPQKELQWGIVVRSEASQLLYWVSGSEVAWTGLSPDVAHDYFFTLRKGQPVSASRIIGRTPTPLSFIKTRAALAERDSLYPSAELRVIIRRPMDGDENSERRSWLAESVATGLLLLVETSGMEEPERRDSIPVEIAAVRRGRISRPWSVTAVLVGQRIYRINLPSQFTQRSTASDASWATLCEWLSDADAGKIDESLLSNSGEPFARRVILAAALSDTKPESAAAWQVAREAVQRMRVAEESSLLVVICAFKILVRRYLANGVNRREALDELLGAIDLAGRRAMRSLHVESLHGAIQTDGTQLSLEARQLWQKISRIIVARIDSGQMARLNELLRFSMIAGDEPTRAVSAAISLALGRVSTRSLARIHADLLSRLVGWRRLFECWSRGAHGRMLPARAAQWLLAELDQTTIMAKTRAMDISLLRPIPVLLRDSTKVDAD